MNSARLKPIPPGVRGKDPQNDCIRIEVCYTPKVRNKIGEETTTSILRSQEPDFERHQTGSIKILRCSTIDEVKDKSKSFLIPTPPIPTRDPIIKLGTIQKELPSNHKGVVDMAVVSLIDRVRVVSKKKRAEESLKIALTNFPPRIPSCKRQ